MFKFEAKKSVSGGLARAGVITTPHGEIKTPAFIPVATKATIKSLTPEMVAALGADAVLANTYHLYLEPGEKIVEKAGGLGKFMNWLGPTFTDSGGFQAFSLGAAFGTGLGKFISFNPETNPQVLGSPSPSARPDREDLFRGSPLAKQAKVTEEGVTFYSHLDGSEHIFTPERSIEIQHAIGADIIFAFDECTAPTASVGYQKEALERTHRWAAESLDTHKKLGGEQALFGIVQGGRHEDLRRASAKFLGGACPPAGGFQGFGIGGSFVKEDMATAVRWVNETLPADKPRHLLGVGEPVDLVLGIENGVDTFDCVAPTRLGRNGGLYTKTGKINILNAQYREDFSPIEEGCGCYTCSPRHGGAGYTRAYLAHLFRAKEMLAATLASIHNLYFVVNLAKTARQAILDDAFLDFKNQFLIGYKS